MLLPKSSYLLLLSMAPTNFLVNIDWEMEFSSQDTGLCSECFCEIYSEGVGTCLPLALDTEGLVRKRKECENIRCHKAKELRDVQ